MASEYNLDLINISGTGRDGRVLKEDVIAYMESQAQAKKATPPKQQQQQQPSPAAAAAKPSPPRPVLQPPKPVIAGEDRTEPLKGIMKAMTKTM